MNGVALDTQLVIGIITFIVFYFLIKQTIKNIRSTNDDSDTIINLNKFSQKNREKSGSK
tara:strand:- start:58 stop:234 length:177 start_codon:yes stop_codon:yes gene_type:complete